MNITGLARHLEISPSTVSRVLSGNAEKYRISAETVERVLTAAARFKVKPDLLGTSLRSGKLGMIGLLIPDITNPFFAGLARSIEKEVRQKGMTLQLCDSAEDAKTERELLQQMLGRRLNGMIIAPVSDEPDEISELLSSAPFPVVCVDRVMPGLDAPTVRIDNHGAGRMAAAHLIEAGHRRIGCLRGAPHSFTDRERFRGFSEALAEAEIELDPSSVSGDGYSLEAGLRGAREILDAPSRPDALLTLSGQGILAVLHIAAEKRLSIPRQLSVLAFDEQPWSAFMNPPITTVAQPIEAMARQAVRRLLKGTNEEQPLLNAHLCERESVLRLTDT